jgi:uncharacterized UPF0160 family protein
MENFLAKQGLNLYLTRHFENVTKIVTHGSAFHADEIVAIETFKLFTGMDWLKVERVFKVSVEDLQNPDVLVLDIGGDFHHESNNFDHHHDAESQATNCLIMWAVVNDSKLAMKMHPMYNRISDIDRGLAIAGPSEFNAIVRNFNTLENGFELACQFVRSALEAMVSTAIKAIESESIWNDLEACLNNKVKIEPNGILMPDWKELAKRDGVLLLASPNARGGWQLVSRDSEEINIPSSETQTFRHNSGFMAVYKSALDALSHAESFLS